MLVMTLLSPARNGVAESVLAVARRGAVVDHLGVALIRVQPSTLQVSPPTVLVPPVLVRVQPLTTRVSSLIIWVPSVLERVQSWTMEVSP
jgi:hypothetical protein